MARGLVTKSYLSVTDEKMARAWVDDNLNDLVDRGDIVSIKQRGLWLITKTHHTSECAKKVLQGKDTSVAFHVGANIPDIAKAQASSQWWSSEAANSGWRVHRVSFFCLMLPYIMQITSHCPKLASSGYR